MSLGDVLRRLLGREALPAGFAGTLDAEERVLATAPLVGGGDVVVTSLGVWLPGRRVSWHLVSKATWSGGAIGLVEADEVASFDGVVLLADRPVRRLPLAEPGRVPQLVHERVTASIRTRHHRDLPGGGAWFVQRKVPGRDGVVLQVRPDPGTDEAVLRRVVAEVARTLRQAP
ncbi:MAG: hypothetical protein ACT4RN_21960 [Pseudonocardia sp.]